MNKNLFQKSEEDYQKTKRIKDISKKRPIKKKMERTNGIGSNEKLNKANKTDKKI